MATEVQRNLRIGDKVRVNRIASEQSLRGKVGIIVIFDGSPGVDFGEIIAPHTWMLNDVLKHPTGRFMAIESLDLVTTEWDE